MVSHLSQQIFRLNSKINIAETKRASTKDPCLVSHPSSSVFIYTTFVPLAHRRLARIRIRPPRLHYPAQLELRIRTFRGVQKTITRCKRLQIQMLPCATCEQKFHETCPHGLCSALCSQKENPLDDSHPNPSPDSLVSLAVRTVHIFCEARERARPNPIMDPAIFLHGFFCCPNERILYESKLLKKGEKL